jgi:hypothetical protein
MTWLSVALLGVRRGALARNARAWSSASLERFSGRASACRSSDAQGAAAVTWLGVALLGGVGALTRFGLDALVQRRIRGDFPLGTYAVNLSGSFALGLLTGLAVTGTALLLAGTAVLGSFTTFST